MTEKKKFLNYLHIYMVLTFVLLLTLITMVHLTTFTNSRYIKKETDEVRGYYTSLFFRGTGQGNCIVLEDSIGHTSFELMNYIEDDVTKRDIEYDIQTPQEYYDKQGNKIEFDENGEPIITTEDKKLYVKDVWGHPQVVEKNTYKYDYEVVKNTGETGTEGKYKFTYQPNGTTGIGKKHAVTIKTTRKTQYGNNIDTFEPISIVINLKKPYKDVYIINMIVVNRLIAFTNLESTRFEVGCQSLNIQTADIFTRTIGDTNSAKVITSKAFKVTLEWENLIIDRRKLGLLHNIVPLDQIINASTSEASDIDITKPYLISLKYDENKISKGSLELYIPQSSNLNIDFFPTDSTYNVQAKVELLDINDSTQNPKHSIYDESFGGYTDDEFTPNTKTIYVLGNEKNKLIH